MTPFYTDDWLTLYGGDCREVLASLPADSVDCVVTSPPYWGLRDYGTATWVGGDEACDHMEEVKPGSLNQGFNERWGNAAGDKKQETRALRPFKELCGKCGATRVDSQLGLERTPEEYVANMVAVFREVRRVLKPSGTCWLNLGDSYASGKTENTNGTGGKSTLNYVKDSGVATYKTVGMKVRAREYGALAHKQLVGIPWRVAFALQADGWYLRSDIVWNKPNPMPESVTDRPTKSHEYLFLLTKSPRYYFDSDAVRESVADATIDRLAQNVAEQNGSTRQPGKVNGPMRAVGTTGGRNIRSVWTIATRPYKGAHFAVFPPELPERCIKAGSSEKGVCPECGAPWERVVERTPMVVKPSGRRDKLGGQDTYAGRTAASGTMLEPPSSITTGWKPSCDCPMTNRGTAPSVILDPFGGSGTVGMVANRLSRRAILIDLNPEYLEQQMKRNAQTPLGLDAA